MSRVHRIQTLRLQRSADGQDVLSVAEIEVTFDQLEQNVATLPPEIHERRVELYEGIHERPEDMIPILKELITRYPKVPQLYNWLAAAYGIAGKLDLNKQTVLQSYQQNPDYLFARIMYAELLLMQGDAEAVPAVFGGNLDLVGLYPDRRRFHITEFLSFFTVLALYLKARGKPESAQYVYGAMRGLSPEHGLVEQVRRQLGLK